MEENTEIYIADLPPIETISNNLTTFFDQEIRLNKENDILEQRKYPIKLIDECPPQNANKLLKTVDEYTVDSIQNEKKIEVNQIANSNIIVTKNEDSHEDLSRNDPEKVVPICDSEKAWHEENALARSIAFESIL